MTRDQLEAVALLLGFLGAGVAGVYALIVGVLERRKEAGQKPPRPGVWAELLTTGCCVLPLVIVAVLLHKQQTSGRGLAAALALGAILALLVNGLTNWWPSPSGEAGLRRATAGSCGSLGIMLLGMSVLHVVESKSPRAVPLGFALGWCLVVLLGELSRRVRFALAAGQQRLPAATGAEFGCVFLTSLAAAMAMGGYHIAYGRVGRLMPLAAAGLVAIINVLMAERARHRCRRSPESLWGVMVFAGAGLGAGAFYALVWGFFHKDTFFLPLAAGLLLALLVAMTGYWRSGAGTGVFAAESIVAAALLLAFATYAAFRHKGGYAVSLMCLGTASLWPVAAGGIGMASQGTGIYRAARATMAAAAVLALVSLVRVWYGSSSQPALDLTQSHVLAGLMIGILIPLTGAALFAFRRLRLDQLLPSPELAELRRECGWRLPLTGFLGVLAVVALGCGVAFFWRGAGAVALLNGLVAAQLVLLCLLLASEEPEAQGFAGLDCATLFSLVVASLAIQFIPLLLESTGGESRAQKLVVVAVTAALIVLWVLLSGLWRRLKAKRGAEPLVAVGHWPPQSR